MNRATRTTTRATTWTATRAATRAASWPTLLIAACLGACAAEGGARGPDPGPALSPTDPRGDESFDRAPSDGVVDRTLLDASLALGRSYLLANQTTDGSFNYQFDFVAGKLVDELQPVRQAGALWGVALIHQDKPSAETAAALARGIDFFLDHSRLTGDGHRYPAYPGAEEGSTGTLSLLTLAMIDTLRADWPVTDRARLEAALDELVAFLLSLRTKTGRFHGSFDHATGGGRGSPSPYYDGEALLALTRYARWRGRDDLIPALLESAEEMHRAWVVRALAGNPDSDLTKGFYQWGSLSFFEIADAGWGDRAPVDSADEGRRADKWARRTIALAHWMIDVHRTLSRPRNTGYAYEGMIVAWELARRLGDESSREKIGHVLSRGLYKLSTWQVGGPVANAYLRTHPSEDPRAVGGVMNGGDDPVLRIDVTQHQMHAVILARRFVYR